MILIKLKLHGSDIKIVLARGLRKIGYSLETTSTSHSQEQLMKNIIYVFVLTFLFLFLFFLVVGAEKCHAGTHPTLKFNGTAFVKIVTSDGRVIYIDPYGINEPDSADIVLITHEHSDHNELWRVTQKANCKVLRVADALKAGVYQTFTFGDIKIKATPAYGEWHPKTDDVGFVVEFDGIKVYHAGGTDNISEMADLAGEKITYALLPINLNPEDLTRAAATIQAKHNIPIHTNDPTYIARFAAPRRLVLFPQQTIVLFNDSISHEAVVLRVPQDFPTIQAAIDAASESDTVIVSEGTYHENIRFNGKGIVVTSNFRSTHDWQTVWNTTIDGSTATDKNFGSTVQFLNSEDSTAVLDGFTITGGTGTKWVFGLSTPQEGGGIVLCYSSATVKNNIVMKNTTRTSSGVTGGGGGISSLYGNPTICGNVIMSNLSGYAGGIVLNWSKGRIRNNIIYHNTTAGQWGGGGMMIWQAPQNGGIVENNTIVGNFSAADGGGITMSVPDATTIPAVRNNIIWGNRQATGGQVVSPQYINYCDVEDYSSGSNISAYPKFEEGSFLLSPSSPCIDAGDPGNSCTDLENPLTPGNALFPSRKTARNDMGAFGGRYASVLPLLDVIDFQISNSFISVNTPPGQEARTGFELRNLGSKNLLIDSVTQTNAVGFSFDKAFAGRTLGPSESDSLTVWFKPPSRSRYYDTISLHHNVAGVTNPIILVLQGNANSVPYLNKSIPLQTAYVGRLFEFQIPDSMFLDKDEDDTLTYRASGLPAWLSFDSTLHTFRGTSNQTTVVPASISLTVTDLFQASVSTSFWLAVQPSTKVDEAQIVPTEYELLDNFPNPFNPSTKIRYVLPTPSRVKIIITNPLGQRVATIEEGERGIGIHEIAWKANVSSGVYFYSIEAVRLADPSKRFARVKRMLLLR